VLSTKLAYTNLAGSFAAYSEKKWVDLNEKDFIFFANRAGAEYIRICDNDGPIAIYKIEIWPYEMLVNDTKHVVSGEKHESAGTPDLGKVINETDPDQAEVSESTETISSESEDMGKAHTQTLDDVEPEDGHVTVLQEACTQAPSEGKHGSDLGGQGHVHGSGAADAAAGARTTENVDNVSMVALKTGVRPVGERKRYWPRVQNSVFLGGQEYFPVDRSGKPLEIVSRVRLTLDRGINGNVTIDAGGNFSERVTTVHNRVRKHKACGFSLLPEKG